MTFAGTTNSTDREKWLSLIEKCFGVMDCREERKVKLATHLLQHGAHDWWILHTARAGEEGLTTWDEFRRAFKNKFYPHSFCDTKRSEFMSLVQSNMTVTKYEK